MNRKIIVLITIVLISSTTALTAMDVPDLKGYVNDYAGILSSSEEQQIAQILSSLEQSTTAQGALLVVSTLEGESIESFSIRTAEAWKLGQTEKDNGLLIIMAVEEKKVRMEVGYGLEGLLTDAKSGYIIREIIIPEFKKGNFANGLYQGVAVASGVIGSTIDISEKETTSSSQSQRRSSTGIPINLLVFIIIFIVSGIARRGRRGSGIFQALFFGSMLSSRRGRHNSFGGGSGFGGGFGGGFSGGGGGFGGGGASGGW